MANIDYQEAKREIVKIFQAENGGGRKIVFGTMLLPILRMT